MKLSVSLIKCGRCGKRYSNPLTHVCVVRMDSKRRPAATKASPKLKVTCSRCGKPLGNPLTHTCHVKTDFKARKARFEKQQKARSRPAPSGSKHDYRECADPDCHVYICRIYKEGRADGKDEGFGSGYDEGWVKGYAEGYPDGIAGCPRPHQG